MTFQRARSEEQREARRASILEAAAAMLDEMPVADLSLNELSRRVGLAKSNVLRYFDSREAVLLELLDAAVCDWIAELSQTLPVGEEARGSLRQRAERVAELLARSLADRQVLCDLLGAQGGVLERNVSVEMVVRHKRIALTRLTAAADLLRVHVPELGDRAERTCFHILVLAGALAPYSSPPAGVLAAYEQEPALALLHLDLRDSLQSSITMVLLGAVPRG